MQLKLIVLAVRFACNEIGMQYRNRQALAAFNASKQDGTAAS